MRLGANNLAVLVLCAGLVVGLSMGLRGTFGLFLGPVSTDLALPREVFGLSIAIMSIVWGASQPIFGGLADRYGAVPIVLLGAVLYMGGLALMATASSPIDLHFGSGVLVGLGVSAAGFAVVLGPVGRAAPPEKRSLALGIASAGGSFGQFAMAPIGGALIDGLDWSGAALVYIAFAALMVPLVIGLRTPAGTLTQTNETLGEALQEVRRHHGYWLLNGGFFVCGFHVAFIGTHLPPFIEDAGFAPMLGATALAVIGLANIVGTFTAGWLGGRYRKKYVLSYFYLARALVMAGFIVLPLNEATVLVFSALIGFLWLGTVPLTSGLVAQVFGTRHLGALFGIVFFSHQIGSFFGAWLGGYMFDLTGNYDVVWQIAIGLGVASAALHWPIADAPVARLANAQRQA